MKNKKKYYYRGNETKPHYTQEEYDHAMNVACGSDWIIGWAEMILAVGTKEMQEKVFEKYKDENIIDFLRTV
jgi:hypothetical protein